MPVAFLAVITPMQTLFPPPLWGRGREGGATRVDYPWGTPFPNPSPQGGRERTAPVANIGAV